MTRAAELIDIPGGPFLLGADYDRIAAGLRASDQARSLGLGAVLAATPSRWVDLHPFSIMPRLVTNGQYHAFWTAPHPSDPATLLVDDIEIWTFTWELYRLSAVRVPASEPGANLSENYHDCATAIDALVKSYAYECQRLLLGHHVPPTEPGFDDISRAVVRVFARLRLGLASVIWPGTPALDPGQQQALAGSNAAQLNQDIERVIAAVEERHGNALGKSAPLLVLLRRSAKLFASARETYRPSELFRPLFWPDEIERSRKGGLFVQRVPWEDLPVVGVSLYEAAGFAGWMRLTTGRGYVLPSEAEYEKAFGWALDGTTLDPVRKHIYPWQTTSELDFNQWFSRDGHSIQTLEARAAAYRGLLEETARVIGNQKLYQGLGFGWQWTRERFNELERKYNRFEHAGCRRRRVEQVEVCEYQDCVDAQSRYFAVRGAPDQLGGPGTVTRRFALSPLRGYQECSFRCVIGPAGES